MSTRDTREIESFKENIIKKLSEKVKIYPNLKQVLQNCIFERASSKYSISLNLEKIFQKIREDYCLNFTSI